MNGQREGLIGIIAESVDRLITVDFGYGVIHELNEAARQRYGKAPALLAAERLRERVHPGDTVIIATGCTYPGFELVVGEPDGPMGAASLARALALGLRAKPVVVAEECLVEGVRAAVALPMPPRSTSSCPVPVPTGAPMASRRASPPCSMTPTSCTTSRRRRECCAVASMPAWPMESRSSASRPSMGSRKRYTSPSS